MGDNLTKEQRSRTMSRIRRRDTKPELLLRRAVWSRGLRGYRLDLRALPGRPDLAWTRRRVAVFVDGAFWHGHPSAFTPGKSGAYWDEKIPGNVRRDREADAALRAMGWTVLRIWDFAVRKDLDGCVGRIEAALSAAQRVEEREMATPRAEGGADGATDRPSLRQLRKGSC
jgi:DNA mismatch endonuclease (patch repair protein)